MSDLHVVKLLIASLELKILIQGGVSLVFSCSLLILHLASRIKHLVTKAVSVLIDGSIIATDMLLGHVHALAVLKYFIHDMCHMIVPFDIELMQEIVLVEIHHFL